MLGCLFCAIAAGDTPAQIVHADDEVVAFLDHRPIFYGHTLVIPRQHHETLTDLPGSSIRNYFTTVQFLTGVVQEAMSAKGTFVAMNNVVSQSVPHLHTHIVPRNPKDGLRGFFWPRTSYEGVEHMTEVADRIRAVAGGRGK
ncbi:MAG: HIT family protein [Actinomycetota bacterium]